MKKLLTLFTLLLCVCSGAWGDSVTFTYGNSDPVATPTETGITSTSTCTSKSGSNGHTLGDGMSIVVTAGNSGKTITAISVTYNRYNDKSDFSIDGSGTTTTAYTVSEKVGTWAGNATTITFTGNNDSSPDRITSINVTYTTSGGGGTKYTVTYHANGSGEDDIIHNVSTVEANMFTWTGHSFIGWNTKADGKGTAYAVGAAVTGILELFAQWGESATITYDLNVGTSAGTKILDSATISGGTNITGAVVDQTESGANGAGASDRTTKLAIKTGNNGDTYDSPTNYVLFKYTIKSGKQFTPTDVTIKVANVGSSSKNNIKYKAVLSDGVNSISATYIVKTQDGEVETFHITNNSNVVFKGDVVLKLWAWTITDKSNGGSAFRMGTPLTISGYVSDIPSTVSGTITASRWNTFSSSYALDLSTLSATNEVKAYYASAASDGKVTMSSTDAIVPAGTGLMINGTAGETFTINTTSADATPIGDNLLVGLPNGGKVTKNDNNYVFAWSTTGDVLSTAGFYYVDSAEPTLPAGKAYLHTTTPLSGKLNIIIDDSTSQEEETDGIKAVSTNVENGVRYNLAGQKVGADYKGIVIVNGKKVIIK